MRRARLVPLAVIALVVAMTGQAHAAFPGANGKIAFATDEIETINPDGTGRTSLTPGGPFASDPAWSPDGARIAFTGTDLGTGNSEIYVMNADGSGLTQLTNIPARDVDAAWSPDGTKIVFASNRNDPQTECRDPGCNFEIYVMNDDGTSQTRLTNSRLADREPAWSPAGTAIAFTSARDDQDFPSCSLCNLEIYVMSPDGSGQTRLTSSAGPDESPNWAPDSARIAFSSYRDTHLCTAVLCGSAVFVMNRDGSGQTRITDAGGAFEADPAWSPDGTKLVIHGIRCGDTPSQGCFDDIHTINSDGTRLTFLASAFSADWQSLPLAPPPPAPHKNRAKACKAERERLGDAEFSRTYGGHANAFGRCVSQKS